MERIFRHKSRANKSGLSDLFGQSGHICQALTLWKLRREHMLKNDFEI